MFLAAGTVFAGGMGLGALGLRRVGELQAQTEEADEPAVPLPTKVQQLLASEEWQTVNERFSHWSDRPEFHLDA